jgi:hypothetical protein
MSGFILDKEMFTHQFTLFTQITPQLPTQKIHFPHDLLLGYLFGKIETLYLPNFNL